MAKFKKDAQSLMENIGGKENIAAVTHCATRMRFVLEDPEKADIQKIEEIDAVKGTFTQSGQFQVIIGNDVSDFFKDFQEISGVAEVSKEQVKQVGKKNINPLQRFMANLGEIFAPLIPALVIGGLILGFRNVIGDIPMFEGGKTLAQVSQFWAGVHSFLWLIGEAIFQFLPVGIVWSVTKKMGGTQILGIVLGITLVSPQLLNAYAVPNTAAADIPVWDFGFAQIQMVGYQAQVIPAILAGFLFVYLERWVRKIVPEYISMIFVPFFSLVPTVLIAHVFLGPIGWKIGDAISSIVYSGLTSGIGWLFGALFGFLYAPLVITGLHHMTNAVDLQLMSQFDGTNLWPMIALSNIAQGAAVLGIIYLKRHSNQEDKQSQITIPSWISCWLGVTEPAMFGVNLKYTYPFVAAMIGSAIAGVVATATNVTAYSIGVGGIPGFLSVKSQYWPQFFICMLIAIVVPFILTVFFNKRGIMVSKETEGAFDKVLAQIFNKK